MSNSDLYIQCLLGRGSERDKAWIPKECAEVGLTIKVKENGDWSEGWIVLESYPEAVVDWAYLNERSQDYKRTRRASDV